MDHLENKGGVDYSVNTEGIGIIEFWHPASNALPASVLNDLAETIQRASEDNDCKVILLKSKGNRAFCAGASFDELIAIDNERTGLEFFSGFSKVILSIRKSEKFVICRVQGKAVGGGVGIAAAADFTYATKHASVKLSELAIGIGPFVVGPAVERKVGKGAYTAMAIDATTWYGAAWAEQHGLFAKVFEDEKDLDEAVESLTQKLALSSPQAMTELKRVFWEGTDDWEALLPERAAISGRLVLSDFTREAIKRFKGK